MCKQMHVMVGGKMMMMVLGNPHPIRGWLLPEQQHL